MPVPVLLRGVEMKDINEKVVSKNMWSTAVHGIVVTLVVASLIIVGATFIPDMMPKSEEKVTPLTVLRKMSETREGDFAHTTGLSNLNPGEDECVTAIVSYARVDGPLEPDTSLPLETRFQAAFCGQYTEIICDEGWVFIDESTGILMLVPFSEKLLAENVSRATVSGYTVESQTEPEMLPIWICDLFSSDYVCIPRLVQKENLYISLKSTDALGVYAKSVLEVADQEITTENNEVVNSCFVTSVTPPDSPSVDDWGKQHGIDTSKWNYSLCGYGAAADAGASIFDYIIGLDENSPEINVVDEEGNDAGTSKAMKLYSIYGIYRLPKTIHITENFSNVWQDADGYHSTVTGEDWGTLFNEIVTTYESTLDAAGVGAVSDNVAQD